MELYAYVPQTPPPEDADVTSETLAYLEACNQLFEQGFLSHGCIRNQDLEILRNINKGYSYFSGWLTYFTKGEVDVLIHTYIYILITFLQGRP